MWGDVFPKGTVPVVSMIPRKGCLGKADNIETYYLVQWDELSEDQKKETIKLVGKRLGARPAELKKQIAEFGLPLRASLTSGSGTDHPGFFF
jgi:hypothetical protein